MEQPIRAAFTGRNTVNRPLRTSLKANTVEDNLTKSPIRIQPQEATVPANTGEQTIDELQAVLDSADHTQEHLDLALLKMHQNVETEETIDLKECVTHNADSLVANQAGIDELKRSLKEQVLDDEKEAADTEELEGTLILEARREQIRDRVALDEIHDVQVEQCHEAQEAAEKLRNKQQRQARLLGRLRWQQASLFTQLQELQSHQDGIENREKQMQDELLEDRTDIIVMKAQHDVHREHLAKQEVEMRRVEADQLQSEDFSSREIGRISAELTSLASVIDRLEQKQGQQRDYLRGTEIVVDRLGEATQRTHECVETLLEATVGIERGHDMITTLARQQDVVETQQRIGAMSDLRLNCQQNDTILRRLNTQQEKATSRLNSVRENLWELGDNVRAAFEILKEHEDILNAERERAENHEISIAKSAGHAMCMLREFVLEVETLLNQNAIELQDFKRLRNVFQRQCDDLVFAMTEDQELIENEIRDADDIIVGLVNKIDWFRMVSEQHRRKEEFERNSDQLRMKISEALARDELLQKMEAAEDEDLDDDRLNEDEDEPTVLAVVDVSPDGDVTTYRILDATSGHALLDDDQLMATVLSQLRRIEAEEENAAQEEGYVMTTFAPEFYCSEEDLLSEESE